MIVCHQPPINNYNFTTKVKKLQLRLKKEDSENNRKIKKEDSDNIRMHLSQTPECYSTAKTTMCTFVRQLKDTTNIQRPANNQMSMVTFQAGIQAKSDSFVVNKLEGHPMLSKGKQSGTI